MEGSAMKVFGPVLFLLVFCIIGAGGGYWWWTIGSIPIPIRLCETRIMSMLKAPTSYQRAGFQVVRTVHDWNREAYINEKMKIDRYTEHNQLLSPIIGYDAIKARQKLEAESPVYDILYGKTGFTIITVGVSFDSKNPMGTMLRSQGFCEWVKLGRGDDSVKLNDLTQDEAAFFGLIPRGG